MHVLKMVFERGASWVETQKDGASSKLLEIESLDYYSYCGLKLPCWGFGVCHAIKLAQNRCVARKRLLLPCLTCLPTQALFQAYSQWMLMKSLLLKRMSKGSQAALA